MAFPGGSPVRGEQLWWRNQGSLGGVNSTIPVSKSGTGAGPAQRVEAGEEDALLSPITPASTPLFLNAEPTGYGPSEDFLSPPGAGTSLSNTSFRSGVMGVNVNPLVSSAQSPLLQSKNQTVSQAPRPNFSQAHSVIGSVLQDSGVETSRMNEEAPELWDRMVMLPYTNPQLFSLIWNTVWTALLAALAAVVCFWIPNHYYLSLNVTCLFLNVSGSAMIAMATTFQQERFQYQQTYFIYSGFKAGFCGVFTTMGNLIEDTERLLTRAHNGRWWLSFVNLFANLVLSFIAYELGRIVALKLKAGSEFSFDLIKMENEERRIEHEVDVQIDGDEMTSGEGTGLNPMGNQEMPHSSSRHRGSFFSKRSGAGASMHTPSSRERLEHHKRALQAQRKETAEMMWPVGHHQVALGILFAIPIVCGILIYGLSPELWILVFPNRAKYFEQRNFDYCISIVLSVAGSIVANYFSDKRLRKKEVQWVTFKINMVSCILIATCHNVLFFKNFFVRSNERANIFVQRFITNYCGAQSSFAGFIDETTILFNSCISKARLQITPLKNILYNLLICLAVFLFVVYSVRVIVFLR